MRSIGMDAGVDMLGPGENPAIEIPNLGKAVVEENVDRVLATSSHSAIHHNVLFGIKLVKRVGQLPEWNHPVGAGDGADSHLECLADIE